MTDRTGRFRFVVGFDLCCRYRDSTNGLEYDVRHGAHRINTRADYIEKGVVPFIGTVSCRSHGHVHEFPPGAVLAAFRKEDPRLVGARWLPGFTHVEHNGTWEQPISLWSDGTLMAPWWHERCRARRAGEIPWRDR